MATIGDLAKTVRSKNAGPDRITFDIIFADEASYRRVTASGALTRPAVARLFGIPDARITDFVEFDPARAVKFTIQRDAASGGPGERDVFGCQQYAPLLGVEIPDAPPRETRGEIEP